MGTKTFTGILVGAIVPFGNVSEVPSLVEERQTSKHSVKLIFCRRLVCRVRVVVFWRLQCFR